MFNAEFKRLTVDMIAYDAMAKVSNHRRVCERKQSSFAKRENYI